MIERKKVVVIGAGVGGLTAAIDLARQGADVTVVERAAEAGGKMRHVNVGGHGIDGGPTVFTMRWIFEKLFADAGEDLTESLQLEPMTILARHAWRQGGRLDLFADIEQSADAIGAFSGADDARGYRAFCARSADIYATLKGNFIAAQKPSSPLDLTMRVGLSNLGSLWRTAPMKTMWSAIGEHFRDPRLRQLFGRYATYVGSSPLLAPATLMLIAHVEQDGVWMVNGGMRQVARALQNLAERNGARFRFGENVKEILTSNGHVTGVLLASGDRLDATVVVFNGDVSALSAGLLGHDLRRATSASRTQDRSLSAITWCMTAKPGGFPLAHHTVFFAGDYPNEFDAIFRRREIVQRPTVYICAQDRGFGFHGMAPSPERLLLLINAPPDGDTRRFAKAEIEDLTRRAIQLLGDCGLELDYGTDNCVITAPDGFNALFPATGGALYGRASHGPMATFARAGAMSKIKGLYLAGGSTHPGAGVPMAAMSGRLAAAKVIEGFGHT